MCMIRVVRAGSVPTAAARSSDEELGSSASHSTRTAAVGLVGSRSSWRIRSGVEAAVVLMARSRVRSDASTAHAPAGLDYGGAR
jgi:hypothetical protein